MVTLFVQSLSEASGERHAEQGERWSGALCKPPIYRSTPFGREICDMMLAVNRAFGKSDYIPCIAWGRNAQYAARFGVGDQMLSDRAAAVPGVSEADGQRRIHHPQRLRGLGLHAGIGQP